MTAEVGSRQKAVGRGVATARARPILFCLLPTAFCLLALCCASATHSGHNTALDSVDLVKMTDDMAMKIAGDICIYTNQQIVVEEL